MKLVLKNKGIEDYKKKSRERFSELEFPIWKRLKMKGLYLGELSDYNKDYILSGSDNDYLFDIEHMNEFGAVLLEHQRPLEDVLDIKRKYGVDRKFTTLAEGYASTGFLYYAPKNHKRKEAIEINFKLDQYNPTVINHNLIVAEAGSEVKIIVHYNDDLFKPQTKTMVKANVESQVGSHAESQAKVKSVRMSEQGIDEEKRLDIVDELAIGTYSYYHIGLTKIIAHTDAKVTLIRMQDFSDYVLHIDNTVATIAKDAKVTYNSIDLGGHVVVTDYTAYMDGDGSGSESRTAYLGSGKRRLDIGFNLFHTGKHTESLIRTKGALLGESRKIFRGNMKFERGSKRSTGSESEYVLLLDKRVHSDAIPALLCDEDDVQGEHAASAGQVNDNQLYYLMSRGFSKKEAMKLIIHGNFAEFMDSLPSEAYRNYIDEELNRRLVYGDD